MEKVNLSKYRQTLKNLQNQLSEIQITENPLVLRKMALKLMSLRTTALGVISELIWIKAHVNKGIIEGKAECIKDKAEVKRTDVERYLYKHYSDKLVQLELIEALIKMYSTFLDSLDKQTILLTSILKQIITEEEMVNHSPKTS